MLNLGGRCRNPGRGGELSRPRRILPLLALLGVVALSACSGGKIEVARMEVLPTDAAKTTFVVVRAKSQDHAKDYPKFADQIAALLTAKGFSKVDSPSQAKYAVMFSYDGGEMAASQRGNRNKKDADEKAERTVSIALFDLARPDQPDEKVFGGRAHCSTEKANSEAAVAAMIDAIMKDFPGKAHETYSVSLPDFE